MTGAAVDFSSIAGLVRDDLRPTFTVDSLPTYAAGVFGAVIDVRDNGIGLAQAARPSAACRSARPPRRGGCRELSPGDATVDLPLADDCPAARRVALALDSTLVPDGTHRLELTVTDGAGNATVQGWDLKVVNHPPAAATPVPTRTPSRPPPRAPTAVPNTGAARGQALHGSRSGALTAEASCPARAGKSCPVALTLRAKLPGRRRTATIAPRARDVKPGAKAKVTLKLSAAARRALATALAERDAHARGREAADVKLVRPG